MRYALGTGLAVVFVTILAHSGRRSHCALYFGK